MVVEALRKTAVRVDAHLSTAERVRRLARQHGVTYTPGPRDAWAGKVTELAGDAIEPDEIRDLILALQRAEVVTQAEAMQLNIAYYHEK
ncbi:hypothetical protein [Labrys sp. 22185]|uniref:hypothetical protein n=1 Tax=Labrys sp. 22185 TaxID=3453888 RepID=UPI003F846CAC